MGHRSIQRTVRYTELSQERFKDFWRPPAISGGAGLEHPSRSVTQPAAMVERATKAAGFDMKIHPHMLRHSCGYKLANDGVDTRTIQGYSELAPTRFKRLFRD
jgi:integrase